MRISEHFEIEEFVPAALYKLFRAKSAWYIDPRLPEVAELVRECVGRPVTINNWHRGGKYQFRGFRPRSCSEGAEYSQHRLGRAIDVSVAGLAPRLVLEKIMAREADFIALGVNTLENPDFTPTWLHLDLRPRVPLFYTDGKFLFVNPL